ncbi:MAG TPA: tetratricopeptide repeat protein [Xanthobacteraceae bacterium]|nr:tetratricopeptide repeat protein [Xanthobacteraceae bacterium]
MSGAQTKRSDDDGDRDTPESLPAFLDETAHKDPAKRAHGEKPDDSFPSDRQAKAILGAVAGLLAIGAVWLLDETLPGPGGAQRFFDRGIEHYKEKKYDEALRAFDRAIATDPDFYPAYAVRAELHRRRDELDAAITDYSSAIRVKPDQPEPHYNRAITYLDLGDPDHALPDFAEYVRLKPDDPDGHLRRAEVFAGLGDFAQALAERDALLRSGPKSVTYLLDRAALRRDFGDLDGAMRDIDTALDLSADPYTRVRHGLLWRDKGDLARALADFEQAIALRPNDPALGGAPDPRPELARAEALRDGGRADDARAAVDAVVKRLPDYAPGYQQRALIELIALADAKSAAEDFATAVSKGYSHRYSMEYASIGAAYIEQKYGAQAAPIDDRPMLAADVPFYPAIEYLLIWRHIARVRAGQADPDYHDDLRRLGLASLTDKNPAGIPVRTPRGRRVIWPTQLVALFGNLTTPDVVLAAAAATSGDFARRLHICEANLYIGEFRLTKNDAAAARTFLQAAVDGCPPGVPEAAFARAELRRASEH